MPISGVLSGREEGSFLAQDIHMYMTLRTGIGTNMIVGAGIRRVGSMGTQMLYVAGVESESGSESIGHNEKLVVVIEQ